MALGKWIGSALGWILSGGNVLGAIAGYCIGSLLQAVRKEKMVSTETEIHLETTIRTRNLINVHSKKTVIRFSSQCLCSHRIL